MKPDPATFLPRGLSRDGAASYIGVDASTFDRLVEEGRMPCPVHIGEWSIWDRVKLDAAFTVLDHASRPPPRHGETNDMTGLRARLTPEGLLKEFGLITEEDLASLLGIAMSSLKNRPRSELPEFAKVGRRRLFKEASVRDYIEAMTVRTAY